MNKHQREFMLREQLKSIKKLSSIQQLRSDHAANDALRMVAEDRLQGV